MFSIVSITGIVILGLITLLSIFTIGLTECTNDPISDIYAECAVKTMVYSGLANLVLSSYTGFVFFFNPIGLVI